MLDPQEQLPAESPEADLATIRLSHAQAEVLTNGEGMKAQFFVPTSWPPATVKENHGVALGGCPGRWRQRTSVDRLDFYGQPAQVSRVPAVPRIAPYTIFLQSLHTSRFPRPYSQIVRGNHPRQKRTSSNGSDYKRRKKMKTNINHTLWTGALVLSICSALTSTAAAQSFDQIPGFLTKNCRRYPNRGGDQ